MCIFSHQQSGYSFIVLHLLCKVKVRKDKCGWFFWTNRETETRCPRVNCFCLRAYKKYHLSYPPRDERENKTYRIENNETFWWPEETISGQKRQNWYSHETPRYNQPLLSFNMTTNSYMKSWDPLESWTLLCPQYPNYQMKIYHRCYLI